MSSDDIFYSKRYSDEQRALQFRYVVLPQHILKKMIKNKLLDEKEWRELGIVMSLGWQHVGWYGSTTMQFRRSTADEK